MSMFPDGPRYRAVVRAGKEVKWRGEWRERQLDAIHDAERIAESLYDVNRDGLTIARTLSPRRFVSGYGKHRNSAGG